MIEIKQPKLVTNERSDDNRYGKFVWEPLERGYGITLGNSLRRVLLSSLAGAAITAIKIDGVLHEFSTIKGVREDVADIILNIKALCFKAYISDTNPWTGPRRLHISAKGEGEVTGASINDLGSDVEILNPEQHIATLDKNASLDMELILDVGRAYVSAEKNKHENQPVGQIPIDSIYSPITRVKFGVTDTRVGNITNYDRLTLEVWTNGSILPDEAVSSAAKILVDYLKGFETTTVPPIQTPATPELGEEKHPTPDGILGMSIDDLELTVRSNNCLRRAGINTVGNIVEKTEDELIRVRNLGRKSLDEIIGKLNDMGLQLRKPDEE